MILNVLDKINIPTGKTVHEIVEVPENQKNSKLLEIKIRGLIKVEKKNQDVLQVPRKISECRQKIHNTDSYFFFR